MLKQGDLLVQQIHLLLEPLLFKVHHPLMRQKILAHGLTAIIRVSRARPEDLANGACWVSPRGGTTTLPLDWQMQEECLV